MWLLRGLKEVETWVRQLANEQVRSLLLTCHFHLRAMSHVPVGVLMHKSKYTCVLSDPSDPLPCLPAACCRFVHVTHITPVVCNLLSAATHAICYLLCDTCFLLSAVYCSRRRRGWRATALSTAESRAP